MPNYLDENGLSRYDGKIKNYTDTGLGGKLDSTLKGAANGVAELDANGKVPSSQLPSFVDDTIEGYLYDGKFYKEAAHTTEIPGETGKIYVDLATNKTYRWSGSVFVEISESLALGETSSTAYAGDKGKANADHIGTMSSLTTTDKTSLVGAVNEVKAGTYTKSEVDNLLSEVDNSITALIEISPSTKAYDVDDYLTYNHVIYHVKAAISIGDALTVGTNIELATISEGTVVFTDDESSAPAGVIAHIIVNSSGTEMKQRNKLQFGTGMTVTDDSTNGVTKVDGFSGAYDDLSGKPSLLQLGETASTAYAGDKGKKIADIVINSNAGSHNSIYRGKYLGTSVTSAQWTAIQNGTFDDLYIGDYWTINSQNWRIAHFDYWLNTGDARCTTHHVVIVPDGNLLNADGSSTQFMDDQNTTAGGYAGTGFFSGTNHSGGSNTYKSQCITLANNAFGSSHILSHRGLFTNASTNGYASNWAWYDSTVDIMSEIMVYGTRAWSNQNNSTTGANGNGFDVGADKTQLALFALTPELITNRARWWLRDVSSASGFCVVSSGGNAHFYAASTTWLGVRPAFAIK